MESGPRLRPEFFLPDPVATRARRSQHRVGRFRPGSAAPRAPSARPPSGAPAERPARPTGAREPLGAPPPAPRTRCHGGRHRRTGVVRREAAPLAGTLAAEASRAPTCPTGVAARLRWVSVPKWMLESLHEAQRAALSYAFAAEFLRRKGEFDFIVSIGTRACAPRRQLARAWARRVTDTDYVQFKGLGLVGRRRLVRWHTFVNDWLACTTARDSASASSRATSSARATARAAPTRTPRLYECHPIGALCPPSGCTTPHSRPSARCRRSTESAPLHRFERCPRCCPS